MIVTLTTDFGTSDGYVAALRGAMLSLRPELRMVDVTHDVVAQDVMEAAFVLGQAAPFFPADTVHLVVVDPGVGTDRNAIAAEFVLHGKRQFFVGPDNGILSLLLSGDEPNAAVVLDKPDLWRVPEPSSTFHGRDVFCPVAAALASGARLDQLGSPLPQIQRLLWPLPRIDDQGIDGMVLHIDRYGNCLTNIPRIALESESRSRSVKCFVGAGVLRGVHQTYSGVPAGEPLVLVSSNGFLEIAINCGNAATLLSLGRGDSVNIVFGPEGPGTGHAAAERRNYV